jgi:hypothetical protein
VNGKGFHGPAQDLISKMAQNDFNFREFRHRSLRGIDGRWC